MIQLFQFDPLILSLEYKSNRYIYWHITNKFLFVSNWLILIMIIKWWWWFTFIQLFFCTCFDYRMRVSLLLLVLIPKQLSINDEGHSATTLTYTYILILILLLVLLLLLLLRPHLLLVAINTIIYDDYMPPDTTTRAPIAMLVMTILIHTNVNKLFFYLMISGVTDDNHLLRSTLTLFLLHHHWY